jgi:hypothetical protein
MRTAPFCHLPALLVAVALSACGTTLPPAGGASAPQAPTARACQAEPAQAVIGQSATTSVVEEARQRAGARSARVLRPDQAVTLEFDGTRLNLDVDASSRVVRVRCG